MSLSDFEILRKVGDGAYSIVYQVRRKADGEIYALKKVRMNRLKPKEKKNALNEVRIMASIQNSNVISYKEAFFDDEKGWLCIVMEYADGGDLYQKIVSHQRRGCYMKESYIWKLFIQATKGLKSLHDLNILHRDMKSANVFLNRDGSVKLGDMNVSKVAKEGLLYTQTGTPYYASPEVWMDKPYDTKSDIWSLGCVLYEAIALKPPFRADDMQGLYRKVVKGLYPPIPSNFSKDLEYLVSQLLQTDPTNRPNCEQILKMSVVQKRLKANDDHLETKNQLLGSIKLSKNLKQISSNLPDPTYAKTEAGSQNNSKILEKSYNSKLPNLNPQSNKYKLAKHSQKKQAMFVSKSPQPVLVSSKKKEILKQNYGAFKLPRLKYPGQEYELAPSQISEKLTSKSLPASLAGVDRIKRIKDVYMMNSPAKGKQTKNLDIKPMRGPKFII